MRTVQPSSPQARASLWSNLRRDLGHLVRLALMAVYYFTRGRRIRKAYQRCQAEGKTYWVDDPENPE